MFETILNPDINRICSLLKKAGGTPYLVGGAVRDTLLGINTHDIDIEVYKIPSYEQIKKCLSPHYKILEFGASFGICQIKLDTMHIDIALPRTERKTGNGHTGFEVQHDPNLDLKTAASRRDFTINSIAYDPINKQLHDPHNGQADLKNKVLRHVSDAFSEDSLRVYRAMQFSARFDFEIAPETLALCRKIDTTDLPKERLFGEIQKCLLLAKKPSLAFNKMEALGILNHYPELKALKNCPQDPEWHPEGDVWDHTMMVIDQMAQLKPENPDDAIMLMLAAVCHDFGKPITTEKIDGRWRSPNHEKEGVAPSIQFLKRLTDNKKLIQRVIPLVEHHLKPALLYNADQKDTVSDSAIRRLSSKVTLSELFLLAKADHFGRTTPDALAKEFPAGTWLLERAEALNVKDQKPVPIITGKRLIEEGLNPGKAMGDLLKMLYEKQLDGEISSIEDGLRILREHNEL